MRYLGYSALILLLVTGGCAVWQPADPLTAAPIELTDVPFFPQRDHHCGPAALATVLGAQGRNVRPDELVGALYVPERRGTLQVELLAAARRHGFMAVRTAGDAAAVVDQLEAGRPVLVLQNLALSAWPRWHYAVVVGYLPERDRFVLRSGRERRALVGRGRFDATLERAGDWSIVLLEPGAAPHGIGRREFLEAAADLEGTGAHGAALAGFRAAVEAWPGVALARLGVANNLYYLQRFDEAETAYRDLLALEAGHEVGLHNLTMLLLELGRGCEARALLAEAPPLDGTLADTARRAAAAACPT